MNLKPFAGPLNDLSEFDFSKKLRPLADIEVSPPEITSATLRRFNQYDKMTRSRALAGHDGYNHTLGVDIAELCHRHLHATELPFNWYDLCCGELRAPAALQLELSTRGVGWQGRVRTVGVDLHEPALPLPPSTEFRLGNVVGFEFGAERSAVDLITMTQGMQYILNHPPGADLIEGSLRWQIWKRSAAQTFAHYFGAACCVRTICNSYDALRIGGLFAFSFPTDLERFGVLTHLHRRLGGDFHFTRLNGGWYDGCATNGYVHLRKSSSDPLGIKLYSETERHYWKFQPYPTTKSFVPTPVELESRTPSE